MNVVFIWKELFTLLHQDNILIDININKQKKQF